MALAAGYWRLGAWVVGRQDAQIGSVELQASGTSWAAGCPELRRDPARLLVSESSLRSLLSGEA